VVGAAEPAPPPRADPGAGVDPRADGPTAGAAVAEDGGEPPTIDFKARLDEAEVERLMGDKGLKEALEALRQTSRDAQTSKRARRALQGPLEEAESKCAAPRTMFEIDDCEMAVIDAQKVVKDALRP
jgi:hypothetical protein